MGAIGNDGTRDMQLLAGRAEGLRRQREAQLNPRSKAAQDFYAGQLLIEKQKKKLLGVSDEITNGPKDPGPPPDLADQLIRQGLLDRARRSRGGSRAASFLSTAKLGV